MPLDIDNHSWLFRKPQAVPADIAALMTPLSGKVFQIQEKLKQQKEQKKKTKDPMKLLQEDTRGKRVPKGKASSKAKAKAKAQSAHPKLEDGVQDDEGKTNAEVIVHGAHGSELTRDKYFVDCLVMCVRSAIRTARQRFGALPVAETSCTSAATSEEIDHGCLVYSNAELTIARECVKHGIIFCVRGEHMLKKPYKKWSGMRPAIQKHAINLYEEADIELIDLTRIALCDTCMRDTLAAHVTVH